MHYRYSLGIPQAPELRQHDVARVRVEQAGRFVGHYGSRSHGDDAGDGHLLLLSLRQEVRLARGEFPDAHEVERRLDPAYDLCVRQSQVLGSEGDVVGDGGRHDLVIRVVEDVPDAASYLPGLGLIGDVSAEGMHRAARRREQGV